MKKLRPTSLVLALSAPLCAVAGTPNEVEALRGEIEAMRAAYEERLQALERRLEAAETRKTATAAGTRETAVSQAARSAPPAEPPSSRQAAATASPNAFNPALSLILSGTYTRTSRDPADYSITGFRLPADAETGPGTRSFSLAESELLVSAHIDPWFRGVAAVALHPDDSVSVEEAYVQTTALGKGLSLKAGRFFSGIGYLNAKHAHSWDFADNPLAYQALLGTQFADDGLQLTWVAPTELFVELGAELGRGGVSGNGAGTRALTAHAGGDIGSSHSWRAGLSVLKVKDDDLELLSGDAGGDFPESRFTGSTRVWVADAVWKWAPNGNASRTNFTLQGEYLRSDRSGLLAADEVGGAYRNRQSGWYLQGVYQFMPRWRIGLRTERLEPGTEGSIPPELALQAGDFRPRRNTVMLDFSPSEFSRWRLQYARDQAREGITDNQVFVQYQMSLGAHGAHGY